jgi:hypothetical protein
MELLPTPQEQRPRVGRRAHDKWGLPKQTPKRFKTFLEIGRDEEETSLERKLRHIDLINALAVGPAVLGALALLHRLSVAGIVIEG